MFAAVRASCANTELTGHANAMTETVNRPVARRLFFRGRISDTPPRV